MVGAAAARSIHLVLSVLGFGISSWNEGIISMFYIELIKHTFEKSTKKCDINELNGIVYVRVAAQRMKLS